MSNKNSNAPPKRKPNIGGKKEIEGKYSLLCSIEGNSKPKKLAEIIIPLANPKMILLVLIENPFFKTKTKDEPNVVAKNIIDKDMIEIVNAFIL